MAEKPHITPALLAELLAYAPETGALTWKPRPMHMFANGGKQSQRQNWLAWNAKHAEKPALTALTAGYPSGRVLKVMVYAHRVAWAIHHGIWPDGQIDHINGDRTDNRICNLRDVTQAQNLKNVKKIGPNKFKGVTRTPSAWVARIRANGKIQHLGSFRCETAAAIAYDLASIEHHGEHGRRNGSL